MQARLGNPSAELSVRSAGAILVAAVLLLILPDAAAAATRDVCLAGCTYATIQGAIDASNPGDVVEVGDGTYHENLNYHGKDVTVRSVNGPAAAVVDGGHAGPVVTFTSGEGSGAVLEGLTLTNGLRGIYVGAYSNASPTVTSCVITGNSDSGSERGGGGIVVTDGRPLFQDCLITNNAALFGSGGGVSSGGAPTFVNCSINGNTADGEGGGVYGAYGSATLLNCLITGNAAARGGGIASWISAMRLINCTVSGNNATQGGALYCYRTATAPPTLLNSIIWGNSPAGSGNEIYLHGECAVKISHCDVQGGWDGIRNKRRNPLFVSPLAYYEAPAAGGDYHLRRGSPCINAGTMKTAPAYDIDGDPRPQRGAFDIGADEWPSEPAGNLLTNGSFERGAGVPEGWTGAKTTRRDRRVASPRFHAASSLRLSGSARRKSVYQEVPVSGDSPATFTLGGWSKATSPLGNGGSYGIEARVLHADGTQAVHRVRFPKRTHGWLHRGATFTVTGAYTGITVVIRYARQAGAAWFDAVGLVQE